MASYRGAHSIQSEDRAAPNSSDQKRLRELTSSSYVTASNKPLQAVKPNDSLTREMRRRTVSLREAEGLPGLNHCQRTVRQFYIERECDSQSTGSKALILLKPLPDLRPATSCRLGWGPGALLPRSAGRSPRCGLLRVCRYWPRRRLPPRRV